MAKDKKLSIGLAILSGVTATALIASTAGSLAWYAYSRSVTFSFVGTTVASSTLLNVGLVDENGYFSDDDLIEYDLAREEHDGKTICFSKSKNGFSLAAIRKYLFESPNAVDKLFPVTTQERTLEDQSDLELYKSPEYSETNLTIEAKPSDYVVLPFAFKIIDDQAQYIEGKQVWLTESVCKAQADIQDSVRVFIEGTNKKFLMKPADQVNRTGKTKVGGLLDLDGDGFYDFSKSSFEEYCYGKFEQTPVLTANYPDDPAHDKLININGTGDSDEASTFYAKHLPGSSYVASWGNARPLEAEYYAFGKVKPSIQTNGQYVVGESGMPICSTTSGSKIGYATFTIFVEGWDHSVIDKVAGYSFNLGLRFEIDRN